MKRSARYPDEVVVSCAALNLPRARARRADTPQFARPSHLFRVRVWVFFQGCGSDKMRGGRSPIHPKPTESLTFSPVQSNRVIQQKKKWEKQELNGNGNPVRVKLHVKTNDKVVVIAGADKGKVTEVVEVFTKSGEILCKDVNIKTKHVKPKGEGETGQIIQREFPINSSNVMHWSEAQKVRSRVGHKVEGGKKVRFLKKTGEVLAN